jgi:hypothetical protein
MIAVECGNCGNCGSVKLSWNCTTRNIGGVGDGRLRLSDVSVIFYLGCDECSETVQVRTSDEVVDEMNKEINW